MLILKRKTMEEDFDNAELRDKSRIDVSQKMEREYWTEKWNITEDMLQEAMLKSDSVMANDVERYLRENDLI